MNESLCVHMNESLFFLKQPADYLKMSTICMFVYNSSKYILFDAVLFSAWLKEGGGRVAKALGS